MPQLKLTQAVVDGLPFQDDTVWYHDQDLSGFNLAVGRSTKTFYAAGEHKRRFLRVKIGRADVVKVNEARAVARDVLLPELRVGIDPRAQYLSDKDETYRRIMTGIRMSDDKARDVLRGRRRKDADKLTVGQVWDMFEAHRIATILERDGPEKTVRAQVHIKEQRRLLGGGNSYHQDGPPGSSLDHPDGWWSLPIQDVTPELCWRTWRNISRTRGLRTAQMFFMAVKVLCSYAVAKDEVPMTSHPVVIDEAGNGRGLPKGWQTLRPVNPGKRIDDIRVWWREVDKLLIIPKSALKVALLTGMRPSEVLSMRWADVDLSAGKVTFGLTKTTDYREVALSSWTVAQLERLARYEGKREYVFCGPTGGRLRELPTVKCGKHTWTPSQTRKEWKSTATEIGVDWNLSELQMGHAVPGVANRYLVTPDLRATVQAVADAIMAKVKGVV